MDVPEGYVRAADAVMAAVRRWKKKNPAARPTVSMRSRTAVIATITDALEQVYLVDLNRSGRALARYVDGTVPDATWLMFYISWERIYGKPN